MTLHIDPSGDDRNPGTMASPLQTLQAAIPRARAIIPGAERRIVVQPGLYPDTQAFLGPEDSGLTIEGAGPGEAILCGGHVLRGWEPDSQGWYSAPAPDGLNAEAPLEALLVNGRFAAQARLPRRGAFRHLNEFPVRWMSSSAGGWERKPTQEELMHLLCREGDLPDNLQVRSARIQLFHQWDESRVGCAGYDPATRVLTFSQEPGHPPGSFAYQDNPKARTYVVWNVPDGMLEPGQWHHDVERNRIVYWPHPYEDMSVIQVIAPVHQGILNLQGQAGSFVRNVTIRSLSIIAGAGGSRPAGFGAGAVAGAIHLIDVSGVTLERLHIHHTAGAGIRRNDSPAKGHSPVVQEVHIRRCHIHDTGGPGVRIDATRDCVVEDCTVEDIGLIHTSALALSLCGEGSLIRHNLVRRCPYSAIQSAGARGIVIEYNRIEEFMQKLDDGAGIYVFAGKGTVFRGNVAYGTSGRVAHAYYLDEQSEDCLVENNLAVDTASPIHNHMGRSCTHRHNVFIDRGDMQLSWCRCRDFVFQGNLLLAAGKITFSMDREALAHMSVNVLSAGDKGLTVEWLKSDGYDVTGSEPLLPGASNRSGDPGLSGVERERLRLVTGGAAAVLGLPAQDVSRAGPRRDNANQDACSTPCSFLRVPWQDRQG